MKKSILVTICLILFFSMSSFSIYPTIGSVISRGKMISVKEASFKRYTLTSTSTIPWGDCTVFFTITTVIEWDGNQLHPPQIISNTVTGWGMTCMLEARSCPPVLESFVFNEYTRGFSNLVFSSNCSETLTILNDPNVKSQIQQDLTNALADFLASN